jgi:DNA-binding SARP family transcriptional activator
MLRIYFLGQFRVEVDRQPVAIPSRPAQSLFAYLALNSGIVHRREKLAGLLWPDSSDEHARAYLRQGIMAHPQGNRNPPARPGRNF